MTDTAPEQPPYFEGIVDCAIHPTVMDADCDHCVNEMNAKGENLQHLHQAMQEGIASIQQVGAMPPPTLWLELRLDLLIDIVLKDRNRIAFEAEVASRMMETLAQMKEQATRQMLITPKGNGSGLNIPKTFQR